MSTFELPRIRETENYWVYSGTDSAGNAQRIYVRKGFYSGNMTLPCLISNDLEVKSPEPPIRCCYRDTDGDGNCPKHSSPGAIRPEYGLAKRLNYAAAYGVYGAVAERIKRETQPSTEQRLEKLEGMIDTLFKAVDKLIPKKRKRRTRK